MNPDKKISFGFSKLIKKQNISSHPTKSEKIVELIECLEGSEIKVKNAIEKVEKKPLVIAIKGNANNLVGRIEKESLKNKKKEIEKEEDTRSDSELTVEELAARQLVREARNRLTQEKDTTKVHMLPLTDEKIVVVDGQEPTIEDYDSVPINDYGLAMLRGMGWKEGMSIGRNQSKSIKPIEPELRPKGLGLGAQKMINSDPKDVFDKNGKQLILVKGAFAKIIAGSHKGCYCEVQGLDEESGRIIVKTSKTNEILTLNELFVIPVTKEDYSLGSKIINNIKYERYKQEDAVNERKSTQYYQEEIDENGRSSTSQVAIKNEKHDHSSFYKHGNKTRKEDTTDKKTSERKKEYVENSSEDKSQEKFKIKEEKQSSSRCKSDEKTFSSKKKNYEKERRHTSDDYSSEDEYYSRRKNFRYRSTRDRSSDSSSSSDEGKEQIRRKKSKKSKKEKKITSDSEYRNRKSKKESKRNASHTKNKKEIDSSSDCSNTYEKYRNRRK